MNKKTMYVVTSKKNCTTPLMEHIYNTEKDARIDAERFKMLTGCKYYIYEMCITYIDLLDEIK